MFEFWDIVDKLDTYCSAMRCVIASEPPFWETASAIERMPSPLPAPSAASLPCSPQHA